MRYMIRANVSGYNPMLDSKGDLEHRINLAKRQIAEKLANFLLKEDYIKFELIEFYKDDNDELRDVIEVRGMIEFNKV